MLTALGAGLLEALLVLAAPVHGLSGLAWAAPAGFCLTLAGTFAACLAGLPRRAWVLRALCGATAAMLAQVFASAWAATWRAAGDAADPAWLLIAAPLLGAVGALLGSLLAGESVEERI